MEAIVILLFAAIVIWLIRDHQEHKKKVERKAHAERTKDHFRNWSISMKVTKEEFKKDFEKQLIAAGCRILIDESSWKSDTSIYNCPNGTECFIRATNNSQTPGLNPSNLLCQPVRYNPQLFIAFAGERNGGRGSWYKCYWSGKYHKEGKLYKLVGSDCHNPNHFTSEYPNIIWDHSIEFNPAKFSGKVPYGDFIEAFYNKTFCDSNKKGTS